MSKHTKSRARKTFNRKLAKAYIAFLKMDWFDKRRGLHKYLNDLVQHYRTGINTVGSGGRPVITAGWSSST